MTSPADPVDKRWGVPNWRDQTEYGHYARMSGDQLRWEYLRRNPDYRSDWRLHGHLTGFDAENFDWPRRYGIKWPSDPAVDTRPPFAEGDRLFVPYGADQDSSFEMSALEFVRRAGLSGYVLALIDPAVGIRDNLNRIEAEYSAILRDWREKGSRPGRNQNGDAPQFLRALDAVQSGLTYSIICEILNENLTGRSARPIDESGFKNRVKSARDYAEKITGVPWPRS